jgi:general secretion pathway protein G
MIATAAIVMILAAAVLPLAQVTRQREHEIELRRALREMRRAIDDYKDAVDKGKIGGTDLKLGSEGFPPDLDVLVEGVNQVGASGKKLRFLRRIPFDPITHSQEWGKRCYQDKPDGTSWCGQNVFDVYSNGEGKALDGTKYQDW